MSLPTLLNTVQKLQMALQAKAKAEPSYRFYSLWDKVYRRDVLARAYRHCRTNGGAPGVDRVTFEKIEAQGVEKSAPWIVRIDHLLNFDGLNFIALQIRRWPMQRSTGCWIYCPPSTERVLFLLSENVSSRARRLGTEYARYVGQHFPVEPLLETQSFGSSAELRSYLIDAHASKGISGVVLIGTHPIARFKFRGKATNATPRFYEDLDAVFTDTDGDGVLDKVTAPKNFGGEIWTAWKRFGHERRLQARVVNYADDLVICCRPGKGREAMDVFRSLMTRLGLTVNERKSRLVKMPEESLDFLGYTIGLFYGMNGRSYIGIKPSKKAVRKLRLRIHEETSRRWDWQLPHKRVPQINSILRGWCGYFNHGHVKPTYQRIRRYTERRLSRWLMRRAQRHGTGYKRYPTAYLYKTLGLYNLPTRRAAVLNAKA